MPSWNPEIWLSPAIRPSLPTKCALRVSATCACATSFKDCPSEAPSTRLPQCRSPLAWQNDVWCMASQYQEAQVRPQFRRSSVQWKSREASQNIAETSDVLLETEGVKDAPHLRFATALLSERRRCRSGGPPVDAHPFGKSCEVSPIAKLISAFSDNIAVKCSLSIYMYLFKYIYIYTYKCVICICI